MLSYHEECHEYLVKCGSGITKSEVVLGLDSFDEEEVN
jgi:hypothetical protein